MGALTGAFNSKDVATATTVTLTGRLEGADAANYSLNLSAPTASAAINRAQLTVSVHDASRRQYEPNLDFTYSISSLVAGEGISTVTNIILSTIANANSPVGSYTIEASGGISQNYDVIYENATLEITTGFTATNTINDLMTHASPPGNNVFFSPDPNIMCLEVGGPALNNIICSKIEEPALNN